MPGNSFSIPVALSQFGRLVYLAARIDGETPNQFYDFNGLIQIFTHIISDMDRDGTPSLLRRQRERRAFIEHRVLWTGRIGLRDLSDLMQLSRVQSSLYLNAYIEDHPGHLVYDKSAKTDLPGPKFMPVYAELYPAAHHLSCRA